MENNIDTLIEVVKNRFGDDETNYPYIKGMTDEEKTVFLVRHQILHLGKRIGKFAAVFEEYEHGGKELNIAELKDNVPKGIIDILRIAQLLGMTGEEIVKGIEEKKMYQKITFGTKESNGGRTSI